MIKYIILSIFLFFTINLFSQEKEDDYTFGISVGVGYIPFSGTMNQYLKPIMGGSMSLDYYRKRWAYYLSINGTWTKLRHDVSISDSELWTEDSENTIFSYGLSVGYSVYQKGRFRVTPFAGLMLSQSRPASSDVKKYDYLKKFDVGPTFSPDLGLNMTFHLNNTDPSITSGCRVSLNTRITYVPWAVRNNKLPYKASMWYLALGIVLEGFSK